MDQYYKTFSFLGPIHQSFQSRKDDILGLLDEYEGEPPFTIQRLAELLQRTRAQYRVTHALMNAINKLLSVTTTMTDYSDMSPPIR